MNDTERELLIAQLRAAPNRVKKASITSCAIGVVMSLRVLFLSSLPMPKSLLFATLIGSNFIFSGMSILRRRKTSYLLIAVFAALPLLGSLAYSVHLHTLLLTGDWIHDLRDTTTAIVGTLQLWLILYLYRNLFAREVREYVWKNVPDPSMNEPCRSEIAPTSSVG